MLPMVMIYTVLVTMIGWGLLAAAAYEGQVSQKARVSRQALYIAEAGAERAQAELAQADDWTALSTSLYADESFGGGAYSVTLSGVSSSAATITSSAVFEGKNRVVEVLVEPRT